MSGMVLLIVAGVLLLAGFSFGLVFLILFLVKSLGGTAGGWRQLAGVYAAPHPPAGQVFQWQTVMVGAVTFKRCATAGVAGEGFYLSIWGKTALIPWTEFKALGQTRLYWQQVPLLTAGDPPVATIAVPAAVFQAMREKLPAGLAGTGS